MATDVGGLHEGASARGGAPAPGGLSPPFDLRKRWSQIDAMGGPHKHYIPAAGHDLLLPLYDPLLRLLGRQERTHGRLIELASIGPGQGVLEIGCGTGALAVLVKRRYPETRVVGLDPDPKALDRARAKADRAGLEIEWHQGFADALPFADDSFDRVLSSLMLHHLTMTEKQRAL